MNYIVLDPQQSASLAESTGSVEIRNSDGVVVGVLVRQPSSGANESPDSMAKRKPSYEFSPEDIAEALRRQNSNSPCYTTQEVLDHLRSLENQ